MDDAPLASEGYVRWHHRPELRRPLLLVAFEGWNDAGDAASAAVSFLHEQWSAETFATIDPEEFFDFTATRPRVELDENLERQIIWPENTFSFVRLPDHERDLVLVQGTEPQLRWRTFCRQIIGVSRELDVSTAVTMGALLAEVPHSRPVSVFGTAYDDRVIEELGLSPSRYEGPTGIVGVLHAAFRDAGLDSASLWAAVPTYLPGAPSPKAALALVERASQLLDLEIEADDLHAASAAYEEQVDELVAEDEETADYVEQLEQRYDDDADFSDPVSLVEQVEQFLRDQGR